MSVVSVTNIRYVWDQHRIICKVWSLEHIWTTFMLKILQAHVLSAFYLIYLESFCSKNLAVRIVFAFSDSALAFGQFDCNDWFLAVTALEGGGGGCGVAAYLGCLRLRGQDRPSHGSRGRGALHWRSRPESCLRQSQGFATLRSCQLEHLLSIVGQTLWLVISPLSIHISVRVNI